ncbi:hypothetical protein EJB05_46987 [Eragrostis curvula]|uniref:Uncharacterized protein n=1 Tax=Eragrostis curvula TaxID=38414 RepID=A0A5J9T6C7_9POAL|nr:hypothetical protein EJB05_46987 [Eragrostis curvula]
MLGKSHKHVDAPACSHREVAGPLRHLGLRLAVASRHLHRRDDYRCVALKLAHRVDTLFTGVRREFAAGELSSHCHYCAHLNTIRCHIDYLEVMDDGISHKGLQLRERTIPSHMERFFLMEDHHRMATLTKEG